RKSSAGGDSCSPTDSAQSVIADRTAPAGVAFTSTQNAFRLPAVWHSSSEAQPRGAQTLSLPHTWAVKAPPPTAAPEGLQSWSDVHGRTHLPSLHAPRTSERVRAHCASVVHAG